MNGLQDPSPSSSTPSSTTADVVSGRLPLKRAASDTFDPSGRLAKRHRDSDQPNHTDKDFSEEQKFTMSSEDETKLLEPAALEPPATAVDESMATAKAAVKYLNDMIDELRCGCCTELLYNPVIVSPCGHYFCGSCCALWVKNGGTSCPACRQPSTSVSHSKLLQSFIDLLLRTHPEHKRPQDEREQADEVYMPPMSISIPLPKPANPDGGLVPQSRSHDPPSDNLLRPCPHCLPNNEFGWRCPVPLADPETDPGNAWNLDNGTPPGHAFCGYCDELHATGAPSTTKCSICSTHYCGISVPTMCAAYSFHSAHLPVSLESHTGLIQSAEVYDAFNGNPVEVEALLDWLREDGRGARGILLDIVDYVRNSTPGFKSLIDQGVFSKLHNDNDDDNDSDDGSSHSQAPIAPTQPVEPMTAPVDAGPSEHDASLPVRPSEELVPPSPEQLSGNTSNPVEAAPVPIPGPAPVAPPPQPSYSRACRDCAHDVFAWGLFEWWARERQTILEHARTHHNLAGLGTAPAAMASESTDPPSSPAPEEDNPDIIHGLPVWIMLPSRKDCENGRNCLNQGDIAHAKEFNHIVGTTLVIPTPQTAPLQPNGTEGQEHISTGPGAAPVAADLDLPSQQIPIPLNQATPPVFNNMDEVPYPGPLPDESLGVEDTAPMVQADGYSFMISTNMLGHYPPNHAIGGESSANPMDRRIDVEMRGQEVVPSASSLDLTSIERAPSHPTAFGITPTPFEVAPPTVGPDSDEMMEDTDTASVERTLEIHDISSSSSPSKDLTGIGSSRNGQSSGMDPEVGPESQSLTSDHQTSLSSRANSMVAA